MHTREKEFKILEINSEKVEKNLHDMGAKLLFSGELKALYFDFTDDLLGSKNIVLRLRNERDVTELVLKKVVYKNKLRDNIEIPVELSDFNNMVIILKEIGLELKHENIKYRKEFNLGTVKVAIDKYKGKLKHIPEFLEIEGESFHEILECAKKLGFSSEQFLNWSARELIEHYKLNQNRYEK